MSHMPMNHRLLPLYRGLAALCGLYILVFGIAGVIVTRDFGTFAQDGLPQTLGLHANRAFAVLSIVAGVVVVGGAVIGHNIDRWINLLGGIAFFTAGMAMLVLLQTNADFLGFTVATCVVSFLIGMVLFAAGLYGRTGPRSQQRLEEEFRHGERCDPQDHAWTGDDDGTGSPATASERFA